MVSLTKCSLLSNELKVPVAYSYLVLKSQNTQEILENCPIWMKGEVMSKGLSHKSSQSTVHLQALTTATQSQSQKSLGASDTM